MVTVGDLVPVPDRSLRAILGVIELVGVTSYLVDGSVRVSPPRNDAPETTVVVARATSRSCDCNSYASKQRGTMG